MVLWKAYKENISVASRENKRSPVFTFSKIPTLNLKYVLTLSVQNRVEHSTSPNYGSSSELELPFGF